MSLEAYSAPLSAADARHLLRRTGFGAPVRDVEALVGLSAPEAAARLLASAESSARPPDPAWYVRGDNTQVLAYTETYNVLRRFRSNAVRERLTLFWHNHFATELRVYGDPRAAWQYYTLLWANALGPVRPFVHAVGLTPAMLRYLNGDVNAVAAPNQNYARELLELFTMGQYGPDGSLNYTEADIVEGARALTGWLVGTSENQRVGPVFHETRFDAGTKTFLGQTGAWGYDDIVRIVFEQRTPQIARFLARKLLAFYVTHRPDPADEGTLAGVLEGGGLVTREALQVLWSSRAFYEAQGSLVRGPIDAIFGLVGDLSIPPETLSPPGLWSALNALDECYFNPSDVAGWDGRNPPTATGRAGHLAWYTTTSFSRLWETLRAVALGRYSPYDPLPMLHLAADPEDPFDVALAVARHLVPVRLDLASIARNPVPFAGNPLVPPPQWTLGAPAYVSDLAKMLLGPLIPHYAWRDLDAEMRGERLRAYAAALATELPEFLVF